MGLRKIMVAVTYWHNSGNIIVEFSRIHLIPSLYAYNLLLVTSYSAHVYYEMNNVSSYQDDLQMAMMLSHCSR